jgi:V8-like Glu-specific endopeptidase
MLRLGKAAASISALWCGIASATPTPRFGDPHALVGYDPGLASLFSQDSVVAEFHELGAEELRNITTRGEAILDHFAPESSSSGDNLGKRFIVGTDDRFYNAEASYPYSAVGRLVWSNGVFCSGALVGPRHVLTARHCLPSVSGISGIFTPGQNNGAPFGSAQVQLAVSQGTQSGPCNTKSDWAVVVIDQRLGQSLGYFGVKVPDRSLFDRPIFSHQGYPGDKDGGARPYLQTGTKVQSSNSLDCDATGPFYSDTDCQGGQSGGPFWETASSGPYIWGTLSISVSGPGFTYSGWGSGSDMLGAVSRLRSEYP